MDVVSKMADRVALDTPESLKAYHADIERVEKILFRQGFRDPSAKEMSVMQSWHENIPGDGMSSVINYPHYLEVENETGENVFWEMRATTGWQAPMPDEPWFALANSLNEHAWVISARGELERAEATRARVKSQRRKMSETLRQTDESGDFERPEDEQLAVDMEMVGEHYSLNTEEPSIARFSMIFGRRRFPDPDDPSRWEGVNERSYADDLRESYRVETEGMNRRQLAAANEVYPCAHIKIGSRRPHMHHVSLALLSEAGMTSMSDLGDKEGAHMGYALPDGTEVRFDFRAASSSDKPPFMLIAGQPGSGKTVVSQALIHQASLDGVNSIFINPKGADSLLPLLDITGGHHVVIGEDNPGTLDPFKFATTQEAAINIARGFLDLVIPDMDQHVMAQIQEGLRTAKNPSCFMEAIDNISSADHREMLYQLRRSSPIIALCMAEEGGEFMLGGKKISEISDGLLLVEFSSDIQLPTAPTKVKDMEWAHRTGVAAVSLLMQSATQMIVKARRGQKEGGRGSFLVIDEAWLMLSSKVLAQSFMESLGRLGRSLDVTAILATQRVSDVVDAELTEYLSRVMLMKLTSQREQTIGLELLGLEDTPEHREMLASSGSERIVDRRTGAVKRIPPIALMRDLKDRVGAVSCEFTEEMLDMYSTNPEDRAKLLQAAEEQQD